MPVFGAGRANSGLPVDMIKTMRAQGLDNNQIIQALQREGYSSTSIFDAMNQADMPSLDQQEDIPRPPQTLQDMQYSHHEDGAHQLQPPMPRFQGGQGFSSGDVSTDELVEAIIDEKWATLEKDLAKIIEWKNAANNRIVALEQRFNDLKAEFDKLHVALISKIDDYDRNITNVGAEVRAMEKVFSKVLPAFTENIAELSRIARDMKGARKQ